MLIKLLNKASVVLLALNFIACSLFTPVATPTAANIEKEEQAVYSFFVGSDTGTALILNETINSYLARNAQPGQLSPNMNLGMDYALLGTDELAEISSQPNWGELLVETYPNSHGYTIFSRVGFNNSLDQAVIYVGNVAGPLMGAGYYYLMEKKNGEWVIKEQVMAWIS